MPGAMQGLHMDRSGIVTSVVTGPLFKGFVSEGSVSFFEGGPEATVTILRHRGSTVIAAS